MIEWPVLIEVPMPPPSLASSVGRLPRVRVSGHEVHAHLASDYSEAASLRASFMKHSHLQALFAFASPPRAPARKELAWCRGFMSFLSFSRMPRHLVSVECLGQPAVPIQHVKLAINCMHTHGCTVAEC